MSKENLQVSSKGGVPVTKSEISVEVVPLIILRGFPL